MTLQDICLLIMSGALTSIAVALIKIAERKSEPPIVHITIHEGKPSVDDDNEGEQWKN